ncbi:MULTISPECIES: type II CAAX prenyl endopeptidase Rce1 family protein [unclassified Endozoicomonas]|uniref:CPBP family glutamic-type intramembrane protease n=1 Tax=unclassified Endozoicomonas TaxID=2644528 RepID=UPI002148DECF|nr:MULTISPECIES: CPBP family glutamic-type intramembrane protease [unclassified Endozoicomonas]
MKKYILIIAICCSLVIQHAKSDTSLLKTEDEFNSLHTLINMSLTDSGSLNIEDKESNIMIVLIKELDFNNQLYYGLLSGAIHSIQCQILAIFVLRPLSLIHDPYNGELKFNEAIIGAVIEEVIFNGHLLRLINFSIESATNRINNHDEKIFIFSNIIKSTLFGLLHLTNPNPLMAQVVMSTINSFSRGLLSKHYGLLSATVSHVTFNSIGCLIYLYKGNSF